MEREVHKGKKLDDGLHNGIIVDVKERETKEKYKYINIVIELADKFRIEASYVDYLGMTSKLGELLTRFKVALVEGQKVDINKELIGKECSFQTITSGKYANVLIESLKPKDEPTENIAA